MKRLAIVDDQQIVRNGLELIIRGFDDAEVVFSSDDGMALMRALDDGLPLDLLLLDVRMRGMDGLAVLGELKKHHPGLPVLFLTSVEDPILLGQGIKLGARGWLSKHCDPSELDSAISAVTAGHTWLPKQQSTALDLFTRRELEIARALVAGHSNAEIAAHLSLGLGTVKNYVSMIYEKLDVSHRGQAIARLRDLGIGAVES